MQNVLNLNVTNHKESNFKNFNTQNTYKVTK